MHRKAIIDTAANVACELARAFVGMIIRSRREQAPRGHFTRTLQIFFCSALTLSAAPDPDLFDGRVAPPPAEQSVPSGSPELDGGESGESSGGGEARDSGSFGGSGGGETVQSNSSKTGSSGGSGAAPPTGGTEAGAPGGGGSGGAPTTEPPTGSSSGGTSSSRESRSFEDFGFGGASSEDTVEVNRSKAGGQSAANTSTTPPTTGGSPATGAGNEATGGSQPNAGSASGDYGTNLPSGL